MNNNEAHADDQQGIEVPNLAGVPTSTFTTKRVSCDKENLSKNTQGERQSVAILQQKQQAVPQQRIKQSIMPQVTLETTRREADSSRGLKLFAKISPKGSMNKTMCFSNTNCQSQKQLTIKNTQLFNKKYSMVESKGMQVQDKSKEPEKRSKLQETNFINKIAKTKLDQPQKMSRQSSRACVQSQRTSIFNKNRGSEILDDKGPQQVNIQKIENYITQNNMKKLEKFKSLYQCNTSRTNSVNKSNFNTKSAHPCQSNDITPDQFDGQNGRRTFVQSESFQQQIPNKEGSKKRLFTKHKRMMNQYSSRNDLESQGSCTSLNKQDSNFDSMLQFRTIDKVTIENSKKQAFEVTINVPTKKIDAPQYQSGCQVLQNQNPKKVIQTKPPKPGGDTCHFRQQAFANGNHFETQSIISDTYSNTSKMSSHTILKPFNLSRSNSRRTKDVLQKEKEVKIQKEDEQRESEIKKLRERSKEIPQTHYIQNFMVFRSTKSLTSFQEFNFGNQSRKSSASRQPSQQPDDLDIQVPKKHTQSILFKTQRLDLGKGKEPQSQLEEIFESYNIDDRESEDFSELFKSRTNEFDVLEHLLEQKK